MVIAEVAEILHAIDRRTDVRAELHVAVIVEHDDPTGAQAVEKNLKRGYFAFGRIQVQMQKGDLLWNDLREETSRGMRETEARVRSGPHRP